ncbi:MAG: hypothetical protein ABI859_02840 [Pseudomonadota bacterium]
MSFEPFMLATFCDDVRQEVGNKLSYLGIYGPNLIVPSFPTTLVKLCCVFTLRMPAGSLPRKVNLTLLRDDEVVFEADLAQQATESAAANASPVEGDGFALTISTVAQLVGLAITQRGILKARADVDGKTLHGGGLELLAADG